MKIKVNGVEVLDKINVITEKKTNQGEQEAMSLIINIVGENSSMETLEKVFEDVKTLEIVRETDKDEVVQDFSNYSVLKKIERKITDEFSTISIILGTN